MLAGRAFVYRYKLFFWGKGLGTNNAKQFLVA